MYFFFLAIAVAAATTSVTAAPTNDVFDETSTSQLLPARATPLQFESVGNSGVTAQQMFLGTANKVSILKTFLRKAAWYMDNVQYIHPSRHIYRFISSTRQRIILYKLQDTLPGPRNTPYPVMTSGP